MAKYEFQFIWLNWVKIIQYLLLAISVASASFSPWSNGLGFLQSECVFLCSVKGVFEMFDGKI